MQGLFALVTCLTCVGAVFLPGSMPKDYLKGDLVRKMVAPALFC